MFQSFMLSLRVIRSRLHIDKIHKKSFFYDSSLVIFTLKMWAKKLILDIYAKNIVPRFLLSGFNEVYINDILIWLLIDRIAWS